MCLILKIVGFTMLCKAKHGEIVSSVYVSRKIINLRHGFEEIVKRFLNVRTFQVSFHNGKLWYYVEIVSLNNLSHKRNTLLNMLSSVDAIAINF